MSAPVSPAAAPDFVGRGAEVDAISRLLEAAAGGRGGAMLVTGDAGVGKTRLVQHGCALAEEFLVLAGAALPLGSLSVPLLPLRNAVAGLPREQRPLLGGSGAGAARGSAGSEAAETFDRWLEVRCSQGPVALVVDDLQWADPATLDVLMWIVAGLPLRSLAVLVTVRRGEVGTGHPLHRWLADVRRLPGLAELSLGPLDLEETRDQLAGLLGEVPHHTLALEVFGRTGGNAYLNRLLVQGLPPTQTALDPGLPDDLSSAVLRAWHRLDLPSRELARVIAAGGRVVRGPALDRAAGLAGVTDLRSALRQCLECDLLEADSNGGYWFHHPLQAEALEGSLDHYERERLHSAFAEALEADLAGGTTSPLAESSLDTLALIADHHHRAGQLEQSYTWTMRAADLAHAVGATPMEVTLLRRLLELREPVAGHLAEVTALRQRLRRAAEVVGDLEGELAAVDALLAELDPQRDALEVAELIVRRQHLRFSTGRGFLDPRELRRAVELARVQPESWQHAFALAELTHASLWQDDPASPQLAAAALERGRACDNPRALAHALAANAMLAVFEDRLEEARQLGNEAVEAAAAARDGWAFVHASLWEANALGGPTSPQWRALIGRRRAELGELGAPQPFLAWLASNEAFSHFHAGDWQACGRLLRVALGSTPGALADVQTRLTAAWMAAVQGRIHEAEGHLARADELFTDTSDFLAFDFDAVRAVVLLSGGKVREAVEAALAGTATAGIAPTMCEWLLPLAARGIADLAQGERDAGRDPTGQVAELEAVTTRFPHTIADLGGTTESYRQMLAGLEALYQAEVARGHRAADEHVRWAEASDALHEILPWEECYALWRQSQALLRTGPTHRDQGVDALRRSYSLAGQLQAQPLLAELEALARGARVPLADPGTTRTSHGQERDVGLTRRETEVLGHIVAGRTYGEIARSLVLSEKTISSHVSHLLSKTGCANRVDLALWATRRQSTRGAEDEQSRS